MADWTIRVAQLPIGFGTPYKHNIIVVMDPQGRLAYELNGGPLDSEGNIVPFQDSRMFSAYTSGQFPVGAEVRFGRPLFYRPDLDQRVVFSGSQQEVLRRLETAKACVRTINSAGEPYTLFTGPQGGRDEPAKPTFNSNSVNATLLQCMGVPVNDPAITSQPGYQNPILSQDQVQQIKEQQNPTVPPAGGPPPGNIPIPRPQPKKRGDNGDGSNGPTFGQAAPFVSPMMLQSGAGAADSGLPQRVIDTGNLLRANGIEITPRTMYVSHVLGPQAAVDLIKRTGSTSSDAVPSADRATGDQMRAWVRALRLGPAAAGIAGGMMPAPDAAPATPDQPTADAVDPTQSFA